MGRREPPTTTGVDIQEIHEQMGEEMRINAGAWKGQTVIDKETGYIEDVIAALRRVEQSDCSEDVYETIQAAITDLVHCL